MDMQHKKRDPREGIAFFCNLYIQILFRSLSVVVDETTVEYDLALVICETAEL